MTTGVIDQVFHFQKTNLVKAAGKDIDDVTIVGSTFGDAVIILQSSAPLKRRGHQLNQPSLPS